MRYFAQNARPRSFAFRRYALPTARFARQTLAVEWKVSSQARNIIPDSTGHITLSCKAYSQRSARQGPKITALDTLTETAKNKGEGNTNTLQ